MLLLATTGDIRHGKNSLIDGFVAAEPASQATESSVLISRVCDILNEGLSQFHDLTAIGSFDELKKWNDTYLIKALDEMTSLRYEASRLVLSQQHLDQNLAAYSKLYTYLDMVSEHPETLRNRITLENKEAYRPLLQWVGGRVTECLGWSLWYREIIRRAMAAQNKGCKMFGCSGIRFPVDEYEWRNAGGLIFEVVRPGYPTQDMDDPTEMLRRQVSTDAVVYNDGTLEQLHATAKQMYGDIRQNRMKTEYRASLA